MVEHPAVNGRVVGSSPTVGVFFYGVFFVYTASFGCSGTSGFACSQYTLTSSFLV